MSWAKTYVKNCPVCGKEFKTPYSRKNYCSSACTDKAYQERLAKERVAFHVKNCPVCGTEFTTSNSTRIYCSKRCCNVASRGGLTEEERRQKERERRARERAAELNRPTPKKSLAQWAREADECGLDYGTYRALLNMGRTFEELKAAHHTTAAHSRVKFRHGR